MKLGCLVIKLYLSGFTSKSHFRLRYFQQLATNLFTEQLGEIVDYWIIFV